MGRIGVTLEGIHKWQGVQRYIKGYVRYQGQGKWGSRMDITIHVNSGNRGSRVGRASKVAGVVKRR